MRRNRLLLRVIVVPFLLTLLTATKSQKTKSTTTTKDGVFRTKNLDYLDVPTLNYYLSNPRGLNYDVAILFYASWDQNSHSFAPIWGQIAHILKAGTQDSKLILGLFDCEVDINHAQACQEAGITHYPTVQFFTFSGQSLQRKKPRHSTKFGGNWQYGDAVLDWLKTMRGLSQWHRAGWGKRLRQMFLKKPTKHVVELPLGLPSTSTEKSDFETKKLEEEKNKMKNLAVRSSVMVEALLFPLDKSSSSSSSSIHGHGDPTSLVQQGGKNYTDVFKYLNNTQGWTSKAQVDDQIVRTCVQDIVLDYCQRLSTMVMADYLAHMDDDANANITSSSSSADDLAQVQKSLEDAIAAQEPFCMLVDECLLNKFEAPQCRPDACPFQDKTACRYLTSCLFESMLQEYADAMKLKRSTSTTTKPEEQQKKKKTSGSESSASKKKKGWFG